MFEFTSLNDKNEIATGDATFCKTCKAIFSMHSKIEDNIWKCEYCADENKIDLDDEERPKTDVVSYIIQAAPKKEEKKEQKTEDGASVTDESVIFCIDCSYSMSESYKTPTGTFNRLQCVSSVICKQVKDMKKEGPNKKAGLVSFSSDVKVIGDGTQNETVVTDNLYDFDFLIKTGKAEASRVLNNSVGKTSDGLVKKVSAMNYDAATALGPALCVSTGLASEGTAGSQVIVCTDGEAN